MGGLEVDLQMLTSNYMSPFLCRVVDPSFSYLAFTFWVGSHFLCSCFRIRVNHSFGYLSQFFFFSFFFIMLFMSGSAIFPIPYFLSFFSAIALAILLGCVWYMYLWRNLSWERKMIGKPKNEFNCFTISFFCQKIYPQILDPNATYIEMCVGINVLTLQFSLMMKNLWYKNPIA